MIAPRAVAALPALGVSLVLSLSGCSGPQTPATDASGDFSVVVGVPPEWLSRIDEARYLEATDCAALCPAAFRKRVTSCHLARVVGGKARADTAAVVCNGGAEGGDR